MHNFRHFYYQNKEKIWKVILIIGFTLGIIYLLNAYLTNKYTNTIGSEGANQDLEYNNENPEVNITDEEAISGENIDKTEIKKINDTISVFLQYCKEGKNEEAYNMLSKDCKNTRYNSIEKFIEKYVNVKFGANQTYTIQKWQYNTYKIDISEDILATGNLNNKETIVEYITIENEEGEKKLNINGYIEKSKINKEKTKNEVKIKVIEKNIYMDYEEYNLQIENSSNKTIKLDELEKTDTIYITDKAGNKFNARMHEILEEEIIIRPKHKVNLSIKFTNTYSGEREIESMVFSNMILDYRKLDNIGDTMGTYKFVIDL